MKHFVLGLGNPGLEYRDHRHNAGRLLLRVLADKYGFYEWEENKEWTAQVSDGEIKGEEVAFVLPETFMNSSGTTAKRIAKSKKDIQNLIVVYDEVDLPLGTFRVSYNRGDNGHNGIKSIANKLNSKEFIRIRVGVSPKSWLTGKMKKPQGEGKVQEFLLSNFKGPEKVELTNLAPKIGEVIETIIEKGVDKAMNDFNEKNVK